MKFSSLILIFFALTLSNFSPAFASEGKASVYDRVIKSGVIRCGYFSRPPAIVKDPKTGEFKGIIYDYMNEIGKILSLKVEWTEEIGLGDYPAALESGRIDAMCAGLFPSGERARVSDFLEPVYYLPIYAFSRAGDTRFNKDVSILNDVKFKIAVLEGGITSIIHRQMFPKAQVLELPQLTSPAELFINLAQRKVDTVIYDQVTFKDFDEHHPGKISYANSKPLKIYPNAVAIARGQEEFRRMLDNSARDLFLGGVTDKIIRKHEKYPGIYLRAANPYAETR